MITFFRNPVHYDLFLSFNTKIFNAGNYFRQFRHTLSRIFFPTFLYCLFIIFGRSHKEEAACLPQFLYETYAVFHHPDHSNNLLERSLHTVFFQYRHKQFGNLFTRKNEMAHLTASCWIVNPARTKALLAYHNIYDSWAWLGGHADGMEDLLAVACKEANEESGVTAVPVSPEIFSVEILGVAGHVKRGKYVSAHLHLNVTYLLQADESQALHEKPDENSGVRWFALPDVLPNIREPEMRVVYQKLMDKCAALHL